MLRRLCGRFEGCLDTRWVMRQGVTGIGDVLCADTEFVFVDCRGKRWTVSGGDTTDGASFPVWLNFVPLAYLFVRVVLMGADPFAALWVAVAMTALIGAPLRHAYIEAATIHDAPGYQRAELEARSLWRAIVSRRRARVDAVFFEAIVTRAYLRRDETDESFPRVRLAYRVARAAVMWAGVRLGGWWAYWGHARRNAGSNGGAARGGLTVVAILVFASAAYATQGSNSADLPSWVVLSVAMIGSGGISAILANVLTSRAQRRQQNASAASSEADAVATSAETTRNILAELDDLYGKLRAERERADRFETEVRHLRQIVSASLAANRVREAESFANLFDLERIDFGVVFMSAGGGRFERINRAFCRLLGRTGEDIIDGGWEGLVDPRDLEKTKAAEAAAHLGPVRDFRNRLIRHDGTSMAFSWDALSYEDGSTIAFAFPARSERAADLTRHASRIRKADA